MLVSVMRTIILSHGRGLDVSVVPVHTHLPGQDSSVIQGLISHLEALAAYDHDIDSVGGQLERCGTGGEGLLEHQSAAEVVDSHSLGRGCGADGQGVAREREVRGGRAGNGGNARSHRLTGNGEIVDMAEGGGAAHGLGNLEAGLLGLYIIYNV